MIFADLHVHDADDERYASWNTSPAARAIARVLTRASCTLLPHGWRGAIGAEPTEAPAACVTARSDRHERGTWFATPVHLVAKLDHVQMPRAGVLRVQPDEAALLVDDAARVFGAAGQSLAFLDAHEGFLLSGLDASRVVAHDPARVAGGDIAPWLPQGADARSVRGFAGELELWLHDHAANRLRTKRGSPAIATLWLWGGVSESTTEDSARRVAPTVRLFASGAPQIAWGDEAFVRASFPEAEARIMPADPDDWSVPRGASGLAVLRGASEPEDLLPWITRAAAFARSGVVDRTHIVANDRVYSVDRYSHLKVWRRARSGNLRRGSLYRELAA